MITIYAHNAHAWPEVYIDEVGWIPFEPTPGYSNIRYTPWRERTPGTISGVVPTPAPTTPPPTPTPTPAPTLAPTQPPVNTPTPAADSTGISQPIALVIIIVVGVLFTALFLLIGKYLQKRRYEQSSPIQKLRIQIQRNLQLLVLLGYKRTVNETLQEFRKRTCETLMKDQYSSDDTTKAAMNKLLPLHFLELYEAVLYGNCPATEDMLLSVLRDREVLLELLKKYKKLAYFTYKIFADN